MKSSIALGEGTGPQQQLSREVVSRFHGGVSCNPNKNQPLDYKPSGIYQSYNV